MCRKSSRWTLEAETEPWSGESGSRCGEDMRRNPLVVQWLELHAFTAVAPGSIPVGELRSHKSPAATPPSTQRKRKETERKKRRRGMRSGEAKSLCRAGLLGVLWVMTLTPTCHQLFLPSFSSISFIVTEYCTGACTAPGSFSA